MSDAAINQQYILECGQCGRRRTINKMLQPGKRLPCGQHGGAFYPAFILLRNGVTAHGRGAVLAHTHRQVLRFVGVLQVVAGD